MPVKARTRAEALTPDRWTVEPDGCWVWSGRLNEAGYASFYAEGKQFRAHRVMYELAHGDLGPTTHVHHRCRRPACVNPEHLEAIHESDHPHKHPRDTFRIVCVRGHLVTPENTRVSYGRGHRQTTCRVCDRERQRARYAARTAA